MSFFHSRSKAKEKKETGSLANDLEALNMSLSSASAKNSISSSTSGTSTPMSGIIPSRSVSPSPDPTILNILPSYHMYQATVQRGLTPSQENYRVKPPNYESTFDPNMTPTASPGTEQPQPQFPVGVEESEQHWENTLLANAHKLKNLTSTKNALSDGLDVQVHTTTEVCVKGVAPTPLDVSNHEFRQGEYIHGYVTIQNTLDTPIPFEMVYVVFEGVTVILETPPPGQPMLADRKPGLVYKFLNMVDLFASWGYANIDRLVTDHGDPHDWCEGETDPWDGSTLSIGVTRMFQPGVRYKRYFTFRIPPKLLDDACEPHDMIWHQEMLPTVGSRIGRSNTQNFRDFGFVDASVAYAVEARVIGKASDFNLPIKTADEYVIAKIGKKDIRVIPVSDPVLTSESNFDEAKLYYKAFMNQVDEKLNLGRELLALSKEESEAARAHGGISSPRELTPVSSMDSMKQKYSQPNRPNRSTEDCKLSHKHNELMYQGYLTYRKRTLTGMSRPVGTLSISTPKMYHHVGYISPERYGGRKTGNSIINLPITIAYSDSTHSAPEIKDLNVEIITVTIKSSKHPIPVPLSHENLFHDFDIDGQKANFDTIVIKPMQRKTQELSDLLRKVGSDILLVEQQLFKDMKSLSFLNTKYSSLVMPKLQIMRNNVSGSGCGIYKNIGAVPWATENGEYFKNFTLQFDVADAQLKTTSGGNKPGKFCLVPDFQSCHMARFYYIKTTIKTSSAQTVSVQAPLIVENYPIEVVS